MNATTGDPSVTGYDEYPRKHPTGCTSTTTRDLGVESVSACRVLLVEDDPGVAQAVKDGLGQRGFTVRHASGIASATNLIDAGNTDVIVLDVTLPDGTGLDFAATLRRQHIAIPILMLTAKDTVADRVDGFRHGADDYLCKPFDMTELAARLLAILRRTHPARRHVIAYADVELDLVTRTVRRGDVETSLSAREAELLAYMIRHNETPLTRERILQEVWGQRAEDDSNVLNVYVNYLRNKIDFSADSRMIHTVRGIGYMLSRREPDELADERNL